MSTKLKSKRFVMVLFVVLSLVLAACQQQTVIETEAPQPIDETEAAPDAASTEDETEDEVIEVPATEAILPNPLPADPVAQTFTASDGTVLEGTFYPAATINAPVIVLMHWAPDDQSSWLAIAAWLQNRGLQQDFEAGGDPWLDASWFPVLYGDVSFNVFTFTFRGCEGGCMMFDPDGWKLDVEAAMLHILEIKNVDLTKVITVGASIGADGAAIGCHYYETGWGGCLGAFSISPGGYLTVPYADEVAQLENEMLPRPAWCLYSTGDSESAAACQDVEGWLYQSVVYEGSAHGMRLIRPEVDPAVLEKLLAFIELYLGCDVCAL